MLYLYMVDIRLSAGKQKEQQDANQAGMGLNPAYSDAYGGATPVIIMSSITSLFFEKYV